jgi:hypothetical protein
MNARTKTFNFPFRGTENHQAYVSTNVRKTLDTTPIAGVQQLSQLQFEIRENEPIRSGEDRYRAVELITSAR